MKNKFKKMSLILSIIFFILFCLIFIFLFKKINDNNQKAEQADVAWAKEARLREDIKSLNLSLKNIEVDRAQLETHFAKSSDVVPFLDTIEKLAPKVGALAQIDSVNTALNSTRLLVGLKATGSFESIYKFLTLLENSSYELDFLSMDLHKLTTNEVSGKNTGNIKWEVFLKIQLLSFVP